METVIRNVLIGIANILVNLAYYTKNERAELQRLSKKFTNIGDAITAIAMYAGSLGYSGNAFCIECESNTHIENKIKNYFKIVIKENKLTLKEIITNAVNIVYDKYVENLLQQFVHVMHNTFRVGGDSPFTNISLFDRYILKDMFGDEIYPDMTSAGDNILEIMRLQEIFAEFYSEGAPTTGKNYRFPVATVNLKTFSEEDLNKGLCKADDIGKIADNKFFSYMCKKNHRRGPFNIHVGEKIASCCRLTSDLTELKNQVKTDSFGNGGISIGSHRVVALNLHRISLIAKYNNRTYESVLDEHLKLAEAALVAHKAILKDRVENGFLKFFNIGWEKLEMFFSTVGYTGIWESYETLYNVDATKNLDDYTKFCEATIDSMEDFTKKMTHRNEGIVANCEEIPAEGASPKCAAMDNYLYKDYEDYKPVHLLSNQMVPLYVNVPIFERLKIEGDLMSKVSGGAILHLNMNETMTDDNYEEFLRMIIEEYGIVHFTINRGTTTCINGHTSIGVHQKCPVCSGKIYTYTIKVVGFNTDTISWTKERRDWEFSHRQFYCSNDILE